MRYLVAQVRQIADDREHDDDEQKRQYEAADEAHALTQHLNDALDRVAARVYEVYRLLRHERGGVLVDADDLVALGAEFFDAAGVAREHVTDGIVIVGPAHAVDDAVVGIYLLLDKAAGKGF